MFVRFRMIPSLKNLAIFYLQKRWGELFVEGLCAMGLIPHLELPKIRQIGAGRQGSETHERIGIIGIWGTLQQIHHIKQDRIIEIHDGKSEFGPAKHNDRNHYYADCSSLILGDDGYCGVAYLSCYTDTDPPYNAYEIFVHSYTNLTERYIIVDDVSYIISRSIKECKEYNFQRLQ